MSAETSLYRRHRPQAFDEVVGQEHVVRTLRNAVERDRVSHAYLFVGSRGTGKTSLAKILARSLNCVNGPTVSPCGECESCRSIAAGTSLDVIEMDAASNRSVEDIRDLRERVGYAPAAGRSKVYILDEAHMLTREAWNAFLKTLEEPPPNTVFVLATTEAHKVMPTIVDRCQRFDFQRPTLEQLAEVVRRVAAAEDIQIDDGAVSAIARSATGSFRDALSTLDQLVAYGDKSIQTDDVLTVLGVAEGELIIATADAIASTDGRAALEATERLAASGGDVSQFARDLLAHLRQLLVIRTAGDAAGEFTVAAADPDRLSAQAASFTDIALARAIDAIAASLTAIREGDEPRMTVELAVLRAARPSLDPSREALMQRLERIEAMLEGDPGGAASTPEPTPAEAPAPTPEPEATESAESAESSESTTEAVDLERVKELWPAVVDQLRNSGQELLSSLLEVARPVAVDSADSTVKIGFPPANAFNKRKAEAADARDRFTEAARSIVGERLRPVFVLLEGDDAKAADGPAMSDDEVFEAFKTEFDAEEVEPETDQEPKEATG